MPTFNLSADREHCEHKGWQVYRREKSPSAGYREFEEPRYWAVKDGKPFEWKEKGLWHARTITRDLMELLERIEEVEAYRKA